MSHRTVEVPSIARVEGDGALHIKVRNNEIVDLRLEIYEPPRYFEGFLRGRRFDEVPDIVPRICGICPVAYQMSAIYGMERLLGVELPEQIHRLRRMLYLAEWIESHMLHVHLLAAPDFLGFESALEMAQADKPAVERGLELKRLGNDIMAMIGGREIHPISPRVGGFSKVPERNDMMSFLPRLRHAADRIVEVAEWVATFPLAKLDRPAELVALVTDIEYPINRGLVRSTEGRSFPMEEFEDQTEELQVTHSNALHSRFVDTRSPYIVGPLARVSLNEERLAPAARRLMGPLGLGVPEVDTFYSAHARVVETAHAIAELTELIETYEEVEPYVPVTPSGGRAMWITEAPRGMLYHRYDIADDGTILEAKIVPPTSQNLRHMEDDLRVLVPTILDRSDDELVRLCEEVVRNYDPCISCATHFLKLEMDRG